MVSIALTLVGLLLSTNLESVRAGPSQSSRRVAQHRQQTEPATAWVSLPSVFGSVQGNSKRATAKQELLDAIAPLKRGLTASDEDKAVVEKLAQEVEKLNPNPKSLSSPLVNGRWELVYTTSMSILSKKNPVMRPSGPIYQDIDAPGLRALNAQYIQPIPFLKMPYEVSAELTPTTSSATDVQFKEFTVGPLKIKAPERAQSAIDITYVDDEVRVTRGSKGNLFVLVRAAGMETGFR
ncbi:unnamed protein product [Ectocarpus sp. 8 AP-2014]